MLERLPPSIDASIGGPFVLVIVAVVLQPNAAHDSSATALFAQFHRLFMHPTFYNSVHARRAERQALL